VWVAADLIAIDRAFTRRLEERLGAAGAAADALVVSASHTHSGPGAFLAFGSLGVLSVDREDAAVRDALLESVVEAVRRAEAAAMPARVGTGVVAAPPVVVSRLDRPLDPELGVLRVESTAGRPLAVVWNYAIHGTMLGPSNLRLSGDVMGVASREVEDRLGVPALFVNGAVGDVSPREHGRVQAQETGRLLAAAVEDAWRRADPRPRARLAVAHARLALPRPAVSLHNCARGWAPRALALPLAWFLPGEAELTAVAVGDTAWVTMPGELQTALGLRVKAAARERWRHAFVAGVSNDYLGYFVTPDDYARPAYVTCATLYGPTAGECLASAASALVRDVGRDGTAKRPAAVSACADGAGRR
jgi:hypothetical protein